MSRRVTQATQAYFDAQRRQQDPRILSDAILYGLVGCTANMRAATESWQRAVDAAIRAGHPERLIAKAAGVTGPAIHARKKHLASALDEKAMTAGEGKIGRARHAGEPLTVRQIRALKHGTEVVVTWSGGNGPWPYRIKVNHGTVCVDNVYQDSLLRGWETDYTRSPHHVTIGWDEQSREWYDEKHPGVRSPNPPEPSSGSDA